LRRSEFGSQNSCSHTGSRIASGQQIGLKRVQDLTCSLWEVTRRRQSALAGTAGDHWILGDTGFSFETLQLCHLFWLFAFWPITAPLVGAVRRSRGSNADETGPRDRPEMGGG
jgi:hypothetical protein